MFLRATRRTEFDELEMSYGNQNGPDGHNKMDLETVKYTKRRFFQAARAAALLCLALAGSFMIASLQAPSLAGHSPAARSVAAPR